MPIISNSAIIAALGADRSPERRSVAAADHLTARKRTRLSAAKKTTEHRWRIYRLRGTPAVFIGSVRATDEKAALMAAIEEFGIHDPQQQKRLLAQRQD